MARKTMLTGGHERKYDNGESAAQYDISLAVTQDGRTITSLVEDDADARLVLLTGEGHPDKYCTTWGADDDLIDSGDTVKCVRPEKGDRVYVWLDDADDAGNDVSEGDPLYYYGSTGDAGVFSGAGSNYPVLEAAEDKDNQDGSNPVRIKAIVL